MKAQSQPMLDPNAPAGVAVPQSVHPTYADTLQYTAQGYPGYPPQANFYAGQAYGQHHQPQQQPQQQPQPQQYQYQQQAPQELPQYQATHSPAQAEMAVSPATLHNVPYQQQPQQHMYSPAVTPVQLPPYHPPQ